MKVDKVQIIPSTLIAQAHGSQPLDGVVWLKGAEVALLRAAWGDLQERVSGAPMARWEWTQAFLESYARDDAESVVVAARFKQGELRAVMPLVQKGAPGQRFLELLSSSELYEPTELLFSDAPSLESLLDEVLRTSGQPVVFERHPGHAPSIGVLIGSLSKAYKVRHRCRPNSPSVALGADPEQVLNAGRRSDLRRMLKRAQKRGKVSFALLTPTEEELPALMQTVVRIEAAGWKGDNQSALLHDVAAKDFFEKYAVLATRSGIFRMAMMYIDEQPVATQLIVECGGALWLLKIGYDEAYAECSPGNLLMMEVIRYACRQKLKSCEFLGVAAAWTRMWTNTEYPTECITIFPGRLSYLRHMTLLGLRRAAEKLHVKPKRIER